LPVASVTRDSLPFEYVSERLLPTESVIAVNFPSLML
jgi:hypothetical protein